MALSCLELDVDRWTLLFIGRLLRLIHFQKEYISNLCKDLEAQVPEIY